MIWHQHLKQTFSCVSVLPSELPNASLLVLQTVLTSPELKSITENTGVSQHWLQASCTDGLDLLGMRYGTAA